MPDFRLGMCVANAQVEMGTEMKYVDVQGARIPKLGIGTWQLTGPTCVEGVQEALARGYRHIDTAQMYENEGEVGMGLRQSEVDRQDVWLTTKLGRDNLSAERVSKSTKESLKRLGTDYVDLLLIHWPSREVPLKETLDAMLELVEQKYVRFVGVSNFTPPLVNEALAHCPIVTNQVEYHPFLSQDRVLGAVRGGNISLTAYCPLAKGRVVDEPVLKAVADAHGKSPAQVSLRWLVQQPGVVAIPKAGKSHHMSENLDVFDFELSHDEMQRVSGLLGRQERIIDPDWAPNWDE